MLWYFRLLNAISCWNGEGIIGMGGCTVVTGNTPNGGAGGCDVAGTGGASIPNSFAGSGAGGGGNAAGGTLNGGGGGSTQAAGGAGGGFDAAGVAGSTPSAPSVSASNIVNWYDNLQGGVQPFFESASGGGGGGTKSKGTIYCGGNGGGSTYGLLIEAKNITAGALTANGVSGGAGQLDSGGGGGGGGGVVTLVYGDKLNDGSVTVYNGLGGAGGGASDQGGNGAAGQIITYHYTTVQPPIPIIPSPFQQLIAFNSLKYQSIEQTNLLNTEFFYVNGTIIPSWLEANNLATSANTLFWLNLRHGFRGNGTITVYMGFATPSTTLFNLNTGEAPELSSPYGTYDSGANVFIAYANATYNSVSSSGIQNVLTTSPDATVDQPTVTLSTGVSGPALGLSTTASSNVIAC